MSLIGPFPRRIAEIAAFILASATGVSQAQIIRHGLEFAGDTTTRHDAAGNTATVSHNDGPSVSRAADGSFVVVGTNSCCGPNELDVLGQRFDATGAPLGTEFQVNTYMTGDQYNPLVSSAPDGRFVVVWTGQSAAPSSVVDTFGQRFDSTGAPAGTEFQVNATTINPQHVSALSVASDGSFIVLWDHNQLAEVRAQRFDPGGAPEGTEFVVGGSYTTSTQQEGVIAPAPGGGFICAWSRWSLVSGASEIIAQRFDSLGMPDGTEIQVNSYTTGDVQRPAIASAADGRFVVVWQGGGAVARMFAQRFDSFGEPEGSEFHVDTYSPYSIKRDPEVAVDADGSFTVVWQSLNQDGDGFGIFGQHFDSAGALAGTEFQVNSYTTTDQIQPAIAADAAGDVVVVWHGDSPSVSPGKGSVAQRFCLDSDADLICDSLSGGGCPDSAVQTCLAGEKSKLSIKRKGHAAKHVLKWKLSKGDAFEQAELGDPANETVYKLCVYDESASVPSLVGSLSIQPSSMLWQDKSPKGWIYSDKLGVADGVRRVKLRANAIAGKTKAQLKAKGANASWPAAISGSEFFDQDVGVTVQLVKLVANEASTCWSSVFTGNKKNTSEQFKAKAP